jgi:predicted NAD/FAD-binding protein
VGNKLEYNGHSLNTLFSDRHNLINPYFYRFLIDILKFNYDAKKFIKKSTHIDISIEEFLDKHHYSENFTQSYLLPMIGSIWSKNKNDILKCSAYFIFKFYANHGLLDLVDRPPWYVIAQGSKSYIEPLVSPFKERIYLNKAIDAIDRHDSKVILKCKTEQFSFDSVIIATHSDQALKLLSLPTRDEINILSAIKYTQHEVILHTDENVMPKRKRSWASWNYLDRGNLKLSLTYYMNRLQSLKTDQHFFVSLNLDEMIDQKKIIKRIKYEHPCLDIKALNAQQQIALINGKKNTYYVGSYWGYGFHEDGVKSALDTCRLLGVENV